MGAGRRDHAVDSERVGFVKTDDPRHGTYAGANAHWAAGVAICDSCRAAATRYHKKRKLRRLAGADATTSAVGSVRRLQAMVHLGYSFAEIGRMIDRSRGQVRGWAYGRHDSVSPETAHRICRAFSKVCMTVPAPPDARGKRSVTLARNLARRNGWLSPLAWDDIDLDESPNDSMADNAIDEAIVLRFLDGDFTVAGSAKKPERDAIVYAYRKAGRNLAELERATGWAAHRYGLQESA